MQAGHQSGAARGGVVHQQPHGGQGEHGVQGRHRLIGQHQIRLLVEHARNAHALQLATRERIAARKQLVGQIHALQSGACTGDIHGVGQGGERFPGGPLPELAGEHGGHHALPAGQGRRLVHRTNACAQGAARRRRRGG